MSVSILECLQGISLNLDNAKKMPMLLPLMKDQLQNAVTLLEKDYDIYTEIEPLLEKYGDVDDVPHIDDNEDINQDD